MEHNAASRPSEEMEFLRARVCELEDIQQRVEDRAAEVIALAENLDAARKEAELASRQANDTAAQIEAVVDTVPDGIITMDTGGVIKMANPGAERTFGYPRGELLGARLADLVQGIETDGLQGWSGKSGLELTGVGKDGRRFPVEVSLSDKWTGDTSYQTCIIRDISERKQAEVIIERLALTDPLTELANRNLFHRRLDDALSLAHRMKRKVALALIDLDNFKEVNDIYGHPVGDALIVKVAKYLKNATREVDTVARLGGDEFAIIFVNLEDTATVVAMVARLLESLCQPMTVEGCLISTGASVGVSFYPDDVGDSDALVKKADLALYQAKADGRGTFRLYDNEMYEEIRAKRNLENELRVSLVRNNLVLQYQPQIDNRSNEIVGVEALVRWRHPGRGLIAPSEFIPLAETSGLIVDLGEWVLYEACKRNKTWQDEGMSPFRVAVNVSPVQFHGEVLLRSVEAALTDSGLDPCWLELEITETMVMDDVNQVIKKLQRLRDIGVHLAIDDFGTGYSSLAHLRHFPIQKLKVDRSFVMNTTTNQSDAAISEAVVNLGHNLGMRVTAEGVETDDQIEFIRGIGCDDTQGYYVSRPLSSPDFNTWYKKSHGTAALVG
jgi:diguanylate cyclase (GGDEF)-like protein/PAS domain S-box-containing protein